MLMEGRGAGLAQSENQDLLKVEDLSIFGSTQIHPIIFEECYVKDSDPHFVQIVKQQPDLLTEENLLNFEAPR